MISVYNSVTRRPHVPREKALRRILISQGFEIDLESPPRSGPTATCAEDGEPGDWSDGGCDGFEENSESECFTDDESVMMEDMDEGRPMAEKAEVKEESPTSRCY